MCSALRCAASDAAEDDINVDAVLGAAPVPPPPLAPLFPAAAGDDDGAGGGILAIKGKSATVSRLRANTHARGRSMSASSTLHALERRPRCVAIVACLNV